MGQTHSSNNRQEPAGGGSTPTLDIGVIVEISSGVGEIRATGTPYASLVNDGVGSYDILNTTLAGTGQVVIINSTLAVIR